MVAQLRDGHGNVSWNRDTATSALPLRLGWIEDQLVVTEVADAAGGQIRPGDVIVQWDGQPALEVLTETE